jgi:putative ABC transport system permease protein
MIFRDGMRLALVGIVPGVLAGYAAARGMSTLLFGVPPGDYVTFVTAVAVTLVMAFAGSLLPTLKAVRVTPLSVLRTQ